jgi:PAS domain-containing protein
MASGVLAVKLSNQRPDYLMWFRKEQLRAVTWAGDPAKPTVNDDPLTLSPRRSFAAWSEIVRGTALPWSSSEQALGRAVGTALVDIILQVNAVRLLIAQHQLAQIRETVGASREPVVIADDQGRVLFSNEAFSLLVGAATGASSGPAADLFVNRETVASLLDTLALQPWRGELSLHSAGGGEVPVEVRAEAVPGRQGVLLGFIFTMVDLRESKRAAAARRHLEDSLRSAAITSNAAEGARDADEVIAAILTNASLAAMDIADASDGPPVAPLLEELEASTQRAAMLYGLIRGFAR